MARQKAGQKFDETIDIKSKVGQETTGYYKGAKSVEGFGTVHSIVIDEKPLSFWGTGSLNYRLKDVPVNSRVWITYSGIQKDVEVKITDKKGNVKTMKKDVHTFDVEFDIEDMK